MEATTQRYVKVCPGVYWDRDTRTIKGLHTPVVLDLISDRARMKYLGVAIFMLIFTVLAWQLLGPAFRGPVVFSDEEKIVSRIEVSTAFSAKMYYGHLLPSILVTIYDYKGERDVSVSMSLPNIPDQSFTLRFRNPFNETMDPMVINVGGIIDDTGVIRSQCRSLEYEACKSAINPDLRGTLNKRTSESGIVRFDDLLVANGATGTFVLVFSSNGTSTEVMINMESEAATMYSMMATRFNLISNISVNGSDVHLNFSVNFRNVKNEPRANLTMSVISFPYLKYDSPRYRKLAYLDVIKTFGPSDDSGHAHVDEHVYIQGANADDLTFVLCSDGQCEVLNAIASNGRELTYVQYDNGVRRIDITQQPSDYAVEGTPLSVQPLVRVLNSANAPIANQIVYAMVSHMDDVECSDLAPIFVGRKDLVGAISLPSDINGASFFRVGLLLGYANFTHLSFLHGGFAMKHYRISFYSGSAVSNASQLIYVNTTVATVSVSPLTSVAVLSFYVDLAHSDYRDGAVPSSNGGLTKIAITVKDLFGRGIGSKMPVCAVTDGTYLVFSKPYVASPYLTDSNGVIDIHYPVTAASNGLHQLQCTVDGVVSNTFSISTLVDTRVPDYPHRVAVGECEVIRGVPTSASVGVPFYSDFGPVVRIKNTLGLPIDHMPVAMLPSSPSQISPSYFYDTSNSFVLIMITESVFQYYAEVDAYPNYTNSSGIVVFPKSLRFSGGESITTGVTFVTMLESGPVMVSDIYFVKLTNDIAGATVVSGSSVLIEGVSAPDMIVRVMRKDGHPAVGISVGIVAGYFPSSWISSIRYDATFAQLVMKPMSMNNARYTDNSMFFPLAIVESNDVTNTTGHVVLRGLKVNPSYASVFRVGLLAGSSSIVGFHTVNVTGRSLHLSLINTLSTNGTDNVIEIGRYFSPQVNVTLSLTGAPMHNYIVRCCMVANTSTIACATVPQIVRGRGGMFHASYPSDSNGLADFGNTYITTGPYDVFTGVMHVLFWVGAHPVLENADNRAYHYDTYTWSPPLTVINNVRHVSPLSGSVLPMAISPGGQFPPFIIQVTDENEIGVPGAIVYAYVLAQEQLIDNGTSPLPYRSRYGAISHPMNGGDVTDDSGRATISVAPPFGIPMGNYYVYFGSQGVPSQVYGPVDMTDLPVAVAIIVPPPKEGIYVGKRWTSEIVVQVAVRGGLPLVNATVQMLLMSPIGGSAVLDQSYVMAETDSNGLARFTPLVLSGTTGNYRIIFASGTVMSPPSDLFLVTNAYTIDVKSKPAHDQVLFKPLLPDIEIQLASSSEICSIINKDIKIYVDGSGSFKMNLPLIQYTDGTGHLELVNLMFNDGVSEVINIVLDVDGAKTHIGPIRVIDPRQPTNIYRWQNLLWSAVVIAVPFFFGNSERQTIVVTFVCVVLAVYEIISFYDKGFLNDAFTSQVNSDTEVYLMILASCVVISILTIVILFIYACIKYIIEKRRDVVSENSVTNDTYHGQRMLSYRKFVHDLLPVGCIRMRTTSSMVHGDGDDDMAVGVVVGDVGTEITSKKSKTWIQRMVSRHKNLNDECYYPQRFIFTLVLSIFVAFVEVLCVIVLMQWLNYYLDGVQMDLHELSSYLQQKLEMINKGVEAYSSAQDSMSYMDLPSVRVDELLALTFVNSVWEREFDRAQEYLTSASTRASVITFCIFVVLWYLMTTSYKQRLLAMRKGDYFFIRKNFDCFPAVYYVGLQVAHCIIGFIIITFFITLILFMLTYDVVREYLSGQVMNIIYAMLAITVLARIITKLLGQYVLMQDGRVAHLRWFTIVDLLLVFLEAIIRFVLVTLISLLVYIRLDISIVTRETQHYDPGHASYVGMILMDHMHNNPILAVFCDYLISDMKKLAKIAARSPDLMEMNAMMTMTVHDNRKSLRCRNYLWLLVTLYNNPELQHMRTHAILDKRRVENKQKLLNEN